MKGIKVRTGLVVISIITGVLTAGCAAAPSPTPTTGLTTTTTTTTSPAKTIQYTVSVSTSPTLGQYLVNGKGTTLYWTTADSPGKSNVPANLLSVWPVFYISSIVVPPSLNASDFGSITRSDGTPQTTYKNWPLYYYSSDATPGQTRGQGIASRWSVVNPGASGPQPVLTTTTSSATTSTTSTMTTASSGGTSISIEQPPMNTYVVGTHDVTVVVQVSGFDLVDKIGQPNISGQGHINYFIHADSPGAIQITSPGAYVARAATSYTWTGLNEGVYTVSVELVNNDNTPLVPPVIAKSTISVYPG